MQPTSENSIHESLPESIANVENTIAISPSAKLAQKVWTRWEHGNAPVHVWTGGGRRTYELVGEGGSQFYPSARRLLQSVMGRESVPTFRSYFRIDEGAPKTPNLLTLLDQNSNVIVVDGEIRPLRESEIVTDRAGGEKFRAKTRIETTVREFSPIVTGLLEDLRRPDFTREGLGRVELDALMEEVRDVVAPELGIDLERRGHEVRKLLFAGFWGKMASQGYDPEEVLQEVYKGILVRNRGTCPWDRRKSKFGYYVHMVINCVLTNYHRKQGRRIDRDVEELRDDVPVLGVETDLVLGDEMAAASLDGWLGRPEHGGTCPDGMIAREILPLVRAGMQRREIVAKTGMKEATVSRALAHLRRWTREWALSVGV